MANIATQFWQEGRKEGRQEGRQEGRKQGRQEGRQEGDFERSCKVALKMLRKNLPISEIADITELSVRQISALKKQDLGIQSEH